MKSIDTRPFLTAIALLLLANLLSNWFTPDRPTLLPAAQAHGETLRPQRRAEFGQATLVTTSPDGGTIYVWDTEIVNGTVRPKGRAFTAAR